MILREIIEEHKPTLVRKVISEEASKQVRHALESVVAHGTGRNAYIEGYSVGGKTGTAQKVNNGSLYGRKLYFIFYWLFTCG